MSRKPNPLDATDSALLTALRENARTRLEDLGKLTGLAPSSIHDRLRRLERDRVLTRWTVQIDAGALGLDVLAFIGVRASKPCSELKSALMAFPEIEEAHSVAGDLSLLLKVRVPNTATLLSFTERLRQVPGVIGTESTVVLKTQFERPSQLPGQKEATP